MGVMLSNISRAPVGVPEKADEIIKQASLCTFVSFLTRYFLLRPPAQDTHAYDMIGVRKRTVTLKYGTSYEKRIRIRYACKICFCYVTLIQYDKYF